MKRNRARKFLVACVALAGFGGLLASTVANSPTASADQGGFWYADGGWVIDHFYACQAYFDPPLFPVHGSHGCSYPDGFGYVDYDPGFFHPGAYWANDWEIRLPCEPCRIGLPCGPRVAWRMYGPYLPEPWRDPGYIAVGAPGVFVGIG